MIMPVPLALPDGVTVLDFYGAPTADADTLLHSSYYETSAAVMGLYVQAADDFSAQLVYTDPNGDMQTKTLNVTIDREHTVASPFADAGIAAYGERPIPDVTNGKITKVAKVNGTWLIWFNGDEAYSGTRRAAANPCQWCFMRTAYKTRWTALQLSLSRTATIWTTSFTGSLPSAKTSFGRSRYTPKAGRI